MKTLSNIILLTFVLALLGCNYQRQTNKKEKEQTISKSGALVFGDKKLTYFIEGEGFPCFVCADSEIQKIFLSDELKKHFKFVFIEHRHSTYYEQPKDYSNISLDTIVDDMETLRIRLGFDKVYVLGPSLAGLLAMEYARKYPESTKGVIMINTPPEFKSDYMKIINKYWDENASDERKEILTNNIQNLEKIDKDSISKTEWNYLYYKALTPKYFYNPQHDGFPNLGVNEEGWNHFYSIMNGYNISNYQFNIPVFLSLSKFDFMVPEFMWDEYIENLKTFTIVRFKKSGHSPHAEEQELFDKQLLQWIKSN